MLWDTGETKGFKYLVSRETESGSRITCVLQVVHKYWIYKKPWMICYGKGDRWYSLRELSMPFPTMKAAQEYLDNWADENGYRLYLSGMENQPHEK